MYDGSGTTDGVRRADVGIRGDRVVSVGDLSKRLSGAQIDAEGKVVAPGFIEPRGQSAAAIATDGYLEGRIRQGVTTELLGEGAADVWMDVAGFFDRVEAKGVTLNVGALVPQSTARQRGGAAWARDVLASSALGVVADDGPPEPWATSRVTVVPLHPGSSIASTFDAAMATLLGATAALVFSEASDADPGDGSGVDALLQRISAANQRGLRVGALVRPFTGLVDTVSRPTRDALTSGSVGLGSNSAPMPSREADVATRLAAVGAFPRLFRWAREEKGLALAEAVRRVTSLPADMFGLAQRGSIREGNVADVVVFDPLKIGDRATTTDPAAYATGVDYVVVNGVIVLTPEGLTGAKPGRRVVPVAGRDPR